MAVGRGFVGAYARFHLTIIRKTLYNMPMFTICYEESWPRANKVYQNIFGEEHKMPSGMYVLLVLQDTPVGVAVANLDKNNDVIIRTVGIYEQIRGKGLGDFFMRSLFNCFTQAGNNLSVAWTHPYFKKFGFEEKSDGTMFVSADSLKFPSKCHPDGE